MFPSNQRVAQDIICEEEDAEVDALLGGVDFCDDLVQYAIRWGEVNLQWDAVVIQFMRCIVAFVRPELVLDEHLVKLGREDVRDQLRSEHHAVVVVVSEAGIGEVGRSSPDDLTIDDEELVVHG